MKNVQRASRASLLFLVVLGIGLPRAFAQATLSGAQLRGTVKDRSEAVIPKARVVITNVETGVSQETVSDSSGRYIFLTLPPGQYTLRVEATGFRTLIQSNVDLRVAQQTDVDATLEVGDVTTILEVTAEAPQLDTVSGSLGAVVDNRYIVNVPLFDREITRLAYLAPGVTEAGQDPFSNSPTGFTGTNFNSNGQRSSTAEVRWDGAFSSPPDGTGEGLSFWYGWTQPSPEAVEEFKVINNNFSAEYGNNGGTVINIVSKSGTNEFHGAGYWWGRRPRFDANTFFANKAGEDKTDYRRDNFGGAIGGPIVRNRTFFFFDYDKVIFEAPSTSILSVPTAAMRNGDFSQVRNPDGAPQLIFNPLSVDENLNRAPFPNNVIPPSLFDPVGREVIKFYPEPTGQGHPVTGLDNFVKNVVSPSPANKFDVRIDHNFTDNSRIVGRFSKAYTGAEPSDTYGTAGDPGAVITDFAFYNSVIEHTWMLNPSTVWTTRLGFARYARDSVPVEFDLTSVGFPSVLRDVTGVSIFPHVGNWYDEYAALGTSFATWLEHSSVPSLSSSLSTMIGAHTLKFGGEQRMFFSTYWAPAWPSGGFNFWRISTEENVFGFNPLQGNPMASLLVGFGDPYWWAGMDVDPGVATKSKETGFYVQDDWRVTDRLTVNLGVRWEWNTPYTERFDRVQFADWDADTGIDVPGLGRLRGLAPPADPDRRSVHPDRNNIAPRVGFAYRLAEKTVLRGGAGVYYGLTPWQGHWQVGSAFRKTPIWRASLDGGITRHATLADPFPEGIAFAQGGKYGKFAEWGFGPGALLSQQDVRHPEIYQWNLSLQRQLSKTMVLELAYSGNRSTHLAFTGLTNRNVISVADREKWGSEGLAEEVPNPFYFLFQGPDAIFNEPDSLYSFEMVPRRNLLAPYPQFLGMSPKAQQPRGNGRYNALMIRFEKRYSDGLNFEGHYTYSRFKSDSGAQISWLGNGASFQDVHNLRAEWGLDGADTPHRFVFGGTYELPIGRGKAIGRDMHPVLNRIIGGWQINGYLTLQSGNPVPVFMSTGRIDGGTQRPDLNGDPRSQFTVQEVVDEKGIFFNNAAFSTPGDQKPGNMPRYHPALRDDGANNIDFSIFKNFPFKEQMNLQVRAEFFNLTNTPRFRVGGDFYDASYSNALFGSPSFGTINATRNGPRLFQFALRFTF